jgi:hypothetical protein
VVAVSSSLLPSDESSGRFQIHLRFPNEELPSQSLMVSVSMTVPVLESAIACLMGISPPLLLFVAPRWDLLDHPGFIVDRCLSDRITPCPYLEQDSFLRVLSQRIAPLSMRQAVVTMAIDRMNTSAEGHVSSPHDILHAAIEEMPSSEGANVSSPLEVFNVSAPSPLVLLYLRLARDWILLLNFRLRQVSCLFLIAHWLLAQ